jgi:hypothetical protein
MAFQETGSESKGPLPERPEIKHVKIHHRRHHSGIHESPTEKLVKAQDAHRPHDIPLSRKIVAKEAQVQADRDTPEHSEKLPIDNDGKPIVPFITPLPYPNSCIGKITVGTGDRVLWTGTGIMCQPKLVDFITSRYTANSTPNPRLLLTAGHTCPWHVENPWMTFAPGYNNGSEPYGVANITQGYGYDVPPVSEFDMAICVLDQDIGEICGWAATIWSTTDSGYSQPPFQDFLECAGYSNSTNPSDDPQYTDSIGVVYLPIPAESGHFKLIEFPPPLGPISGAVLWTYFNNMVCCAGVMSGMIGNDPPSGVGFAGGEALGDLLTAVRISTSTASRIVLKHYRVFSAGAAISSSQRWVYSQRLCTINF